MIEFWTESLKTARPDIEAMIPAQWSETGDQDIECEPSWSLYEALEKAGALIIVMARDETGKAAGYLTGTISAHPNSSRYRVVTYPTYFVMPRPNRALVLRSMLSYAVNVALKRGAWKVSVKTEYNHSAGRLLEAMGMAPSSVEYVMTRPMLEAKHA